MENRYLARLRFVANGPAAEGEWALASTAADRYTEWVGIYSKDPKVMVWLIEEAGGSVCFERGRRRARPFRSTPGLPARRSGCRAPGRSRRRFRRRGTHIR